MMNWFYRWWYKKYTDDIDLDGIYKLVKVLTCFAGFFMGAFLGWLVYTPITDYLLTKDSEYQSTYWNEIKTLEIEGPSGFVEMNATEYNLFLTKPYFTVVTTLSESDIKNSLHLHGWSPHDTVYTKEINGTLYTVELKPFRKNIKVMMTMQ